MADRLHRRGGTFPCPGTLLLGDHLFTVQGGRQALTLLQQCLQCGNLGWIQTAFLLVKQGGWVSPLATKKGMLGIMGPA